MEQQRSASLDDACKEQLEASSESNLDVSDNFDFLSELQLKYPHSRISITTNLGNVRLCVQPSKDFDLKLDFCVSSKLPKTVQFVTVTSACLSKRDVHRLERSIELQLSTVADDQVLQTVMDTVSDCLDSDCLFGKKESEGEIGKGKRKKKSMDKKVRDRDIVCMTVNEVSKPEPKGKKSKRRLRRMMEEEEIPPEDLDICQQTESVVEPYYKAESSICIITGDSARPTHFIAIRVTNPIITDQLSQVQQELLVEEPLLQKGLFATEIFHLTLFTLGLDTHEDIDNCIQSFKKLSYVVQHSMPLKPIVVQGISQFYNRAVFAKVILEQDFINFRNLLEQELEDSGVEIRDMYEQYCPHVTLIKLKRPERKLLGPRNIQPAIYAHFKERFFGQQKIDGLQLCVMDGTRRGDGFYTTLWEINCAQK